MICPAEIGSGRSLAPKPAHANNIAIIFICAVSLLSPGPCWKQDIMEDSSERIDQIVRSLRVLHIRHCQALFLLLDTSNLRFDDFAQCKKASAVEEPVARQLKS